MSQNKLALISMDLEDWFDLKYLEPKTKSKKLSMVDGVYRFLEVLESHGVKATFFVLKSFWQNHKTVVKELVSKGHEISLHGVDHRLLYEVPDREFEEGVIRLRAEIEESLGKPVKGFRASCFSMTDSKLIILKQRGFLYDSSRMEFPMQYIQKTLNVDGWNSPAIGVHEKGGFWEFDLSTIKVGRRVVPVAGGGYFRLFPWRLFKCFLQRWIDKNSVYTFYLHPFETSIMELTSTEAELNLKDRFRFQVGRSQVLYKFDQICTMLKKNSFHFTTYSDACSISLHHG